MIHDRAEYLNSRYFGYPRPRHKDPMAIHCYMILTWSASQLQGLGYQRPLSTCSEYLRRAACGKGPCRVRGQRALWFGFRLQGLVFRV